MLVSGFYALENSQLQKRIIACPKETMSVLGFLRELRHGQRISSEVLVTGLDRTLYQVYRMNGEGEMGRQLVKQTVDVFSRSVYNPQARRQLLSDAPVIIFVLEYVEHGERWKAGVRIRKAIGDEPLELFWLEQLLPHCEVTDVGGESVCYSAF